MRRHDTTRALRHGKGRSVALLIAVKVGIVALVLVLPSGLALSLGAAHGVALLLVGMAAAVLVVASAVKHRSRK